MNLRQNSASLSAVYVGNGLCIVEILNVNSRVMKWLQEDPLYFIRGFWSMPFTLNCIVKKINMFFKSYEMVSGYYTRGCSNPVINC